MPRLTQKIARALRPARPAVTAAQADVHFHEGAHGPYVCDHARCASPGVDPSRS